MVRADIDRPIVNADAIDGPAVHRVGERRHRRIAHGFPKICGTATTGVRVAKRCPRRKFAGLFRGDGAVGEVAAAAFRPGQRECSPPGIGLAHRRAGAIALSSQAENSETSGSNAMASKR